MRLTNLNLYFLTPTRQHLTRLALCVSLCMQSLMYESEANNLFGVNHTQWAINSFSVNGRSGVDIIAPHQSGGGACCFNAPLQWYPGLAVRVNWETGIAYAEGFPGFANDEKYEEWAKNFRSLKRQHSAIVEIPNYMGQEVCGLTVHFLSCDKIEVTTSCHAYGSSQYPIKAPLYSREPEACQK